MSSSKSTHHKNLPFRPWEISILVLAGLIALSATGLLISRFSIRKAFFPNEDESIGLRTIGKIKSSVNSTLRQGRGHMEYAPIGEGDPIYLQDTVMSGPDSAISLLLEDGTEIELSENSMIRLTHEGRLRMNGLNRKTVVEVVTGSIAARATESSKIFLRSRGEIFAPNDFRQGMEISRKGTRTATRPIDRTQPSAIEKMREKHIASRPPPRSLPQAPIQATPLAAPKAQVIAKSEIKPQIMPTASPSALPIVPPTKPTIPSIPSIPSNIVMNKGATELLHAGKTKFKARTETASVFELMPADNSTVDSARSGFKWRANPEDAIFTLKLRSPDGKEEAITVKADGDVATVERPLTAAGEYVWKVEDTQGAILAMRTLHVRSLSAAIETEEPVLLGRIPVARRAGDPETLWAFRFRWKPVTGIQDYRIQITRNLKDSPNTVADTRVSGTEFTLPFRREWESERLFFRISANLPGGRKAFSKTLPFNFTYLPPAQKNPAHKKIITRDGLNEGAVTLSWSSSGDAKSFTLEIAKDAAFTQRVELEKTSAREFRFYPPDGGLYFWRLQAHKESLSSPWSEGFEFTIK